MNRYFSSALFLAFAAASFGSANAGVIGPNESVTRAASGTSTHAVAGPSTDGLAVSLSTSTPTVSVGSPVRIGIEVRNVSPVSQFLLLPLSPCGYLISLTDGSTGSKSDISPKNCTVYSAGPWNIDPGTSAFLAFRLSDYAKIPVGTYRMRIEGLWRYPSQTGTAKRINIQSNPVTVIVSP
jgi:hypothetical protein